jgi:hypothetical protein
MSFLFLIYLYFNILCHLVSAFVVKVFPLYLFQFLIYVRGNRLTPRDSFWIAFLLTLDYVVPIFPHIFHGAFPLLLAIQVGKKLQYEFTHSLALQQKVSLYAK